MRKNALESAGVFYRDNHAPLTRISYIPNAHPTNVYLLELSQKTPFIIVTPPNGEEEMTFADLVIKITPHKYARGGRPQQCSHIGYYWDKIRILCDPIEAKTDPLDPTL